MKAKKRLFVFLLCALAAGFAATGCDSFNGEDGAPGADGRPGPAGEDGEIVPRDFPCDECVNTTSTDIMKGSILGDQMAQYQINHEHLQANIIWEANIKNDEVGFYKLKQNSVDSARIQNFAVLNEDLNADAVDARVLKKDAVTTDKIAAEAVDDSKIKTGVNGAKIAANTLDGSIALINDSVTNEKLRTGIAGSKVDFGLCADRAIPVAKVDILANSIPGSAVNFASAANIPGSAIQNGSITSDKIQTGALTRIYLKRGTADVNITDTAWHDMPQMNFTFPARGGVYQFQFTGGFQALGAFEDITVEMQVYNPGGTLRASIPIHSSQDADDVLFYYIAYYGYNYYHYVAPVMINWVDEIDVPGTYQVNVRWKGGTGSYSSVFRDLRNTSASGMRQLVVIEYPAADLVDLTGP